MRERLDPRIDPAWVSDLRSDPRDWNSLKQQKDGLDAMEATGFVTFPKPQVTTPRRVIRAARRAIGI